MLLIGRIAYWHLSFRAKNTDVFVKPTLKKTSQRESLKTIKINQHTMHELTDRELFLALQYAKSLDENAGREIILRFQNEQPALAQAVFGIFPSMIAQQNQDMSHLFMDLCFDVICVFEHAFGTLPAQKTIDVEWLEKQAALVDSELQALMPETAMDEKIRDKLQNRFKQREHEDDPQTGLVKFMNDSIDEFAAENSTRVDAIKITQVMIYVVIRLLSSLYKHTSGKLLA